MHKTISPLPTAPKAGAGSCLSAPVSTWRQAPVEASHTRAVQSLESVTTVWPSWLISTWFTAAAGQGRKLGTRLGELEGSSWETR